MIQKWQRIDPTIPVQLDRKRFIIKTFIQPTGKKAVFTTVNFESTLTAAVIALTASNQVIIARQFRPGPEMIMDELPGGVVDANELPEAAAKRELLEETGYLTGTIVELGTAIYEPYNNSTAQYYLAYDCHPSPGGQQLEEDEYVEVQLISIEMLIQNAKKGVMTDGVAVLMAYDKLMKRQEEEHGSSH